MKQKKLLKYIVVAILLGVLTGWICHHFFNEGEQLEANRFLFQYRHRYLFTSHQNDYCTTGICHNCVWHCIYG